ncbi:CHAT domain-containing protein [Microcoleus sp. AT9_B5]
MKPELKKNHQIETLVFVLGGNLWNIPMTVLYNGKAEKYLVEDKYARSISRGIQVFAPQPLQPKLKVFVGIGEPHNIDGKNLFLRS